jgi:hypothetical protein
MKIAYGRREKEYRKQENRYGKQEKEAEQATIGHVCSLSRI